MDKNKKERLEVKGWKVGSVKEFFDFTFEENALIEIKLARLSQFKSAGAKKL